MCCSVLQCVVVFGNVLQCFSKLSAVLLEGLYDLCAAACCSVSHCIAECLKNALPFRLRVSMCHVLQCVAVCCSVLQCLAVCRNVLQCVAVCCSVLQCVAV